MRIALVSQEYPPDTARGGIGSQTAIKARGLAALGHEVHVVASGTDADRLTRIVDEGGVTVHRIPPPDAQAAVQTDAAWWVGYSWSVLRALSELERARAFDVVDFAEYGAEGYAYLLNRSEWRDTPVAVQLHGPLAMFAERTGWPEHGSDLHRVGTAMEDLVMTRADALMACSVNIRDFVCARLGIAPERIAVVNCGVDAEGFEPPAEPSDEGEPVVLFVGNVESSKGVDVALEAVLALRERHPALRLRVLGKGTLVEDLAARARAAGAPGCLELVGFVAERERLPAYYRAASVFCSPAEHEPGVANVFIEAMACGCPAIASAAGGGAEAVADGETGFVVPARDVAATTRAIDRILSEPALRRRMSRAARRRVDEHFAAPAYVRRILDVYAAAIERAGHRAA